MFGFFVLLEKQILSQVLARQQTAAGVQTGFLLFDCVTSSNLAGPAAERGPHGMVLPPPAFTMGMAAHADMRCYVVFYDEG